MEYLSASFCWQQHADISQMYLITTLGRCLSHVSHFHTPFTKIKKMSKWWVTVFKPRSSSCFGLWNLAPRARAALFEYMQFMRVLENRTFCSLFTNRLRPFRDFNHHRNQHQPPFLFSSETWDAALSSLSLSVFRACNDVCVSLSDSFKCFHTTDVFAALVRASIWSRHLLSSSLQNQQEMLLTTTRYTSHQTVHLAFILFLKIKLDHYLLMLVKV